MVAYQKGKRHRVTQKILLENEVDDADILFVRERSFTRFPVCVGLQT